MIRILLLVFRPFKRAPHCITGSNRYDILLPHGGRSYSKHGLTDLKGRKVAAQNWLIRQSKDPYVRRAREESYRCRSAFKLLELDDKYDFLHPGQVVIDLGAAPGSWSQVAVNRVNAMNVDHHKPVGRVISVDMQHMLRIEGATVLPLSDFTLPSIQATILRALNQEGPPGTAGILLPPPRPNQRHPSDPPRSSQTVNLQGHDSSTVSNENDSVEEISGGDTIGRNEHSSSRSDAIGQSGAVAPPTRSDAIGQSGVIAPPTRRRADVLLSDMAPPPSGIKSLDHQQIVQLAGAVLRFSLVALAGGGTCLVKIWRGPEMDRLVGVMQKCFGQVQAVKPAASRADSAEIFILAQDFKV